MTDVPSKTYAVHAPIPTLRGAVETRVLFDMDDSVDGWTPATIFGISATVGQVPLFHVLLDDGSVFSDIPPSVIHVGRPSNYERLHLKDLVYFNCPSVEFSLVQLDHLASLPAHYYARLAGRFVTGRYLFSMDYYGEEDWNHALLLENGQIAFSPNQKIVFGGPRPGNDHKFPPYKKLNHTFSV